MEIVTRASTAALVDAFNAGRSTLDSVRAWTGRVLAADELEIADGDAAAVAAVINVFEDDSLATSELRWLAVPMAAVLRHPMSSDSAATMINLLARRSHVSELFVRASRGELSAIALGNALSKTNLATAVQRKLVARRRKGYAEVAAALHAGIVESLLEFV